jgi:dTMP kinase
MLAKNPCKGKLIVVEGIDGSGKSTQIDLIHKSLLEKGKTVYFSESNTSPLVKSTTRMGKKEKSITPTPSASSRLPILPTVGKISSCRC